MSITVPIQYTNQKHIPRFSIRFARINNNIVLCMFVCFFCLVHFHSLICTKCGKDHLRGPALFTPVADRSTVELSLPVLTTWDYREITIPNFRCIKWATAVVERPLSENKINIATENHLLNYICHNYSWDSDTSNISNLTAVVA